jgi:hypothetical protein
MPVTKYTQKSELTQQILAQLPGIQFPLEQTIRLWWASPDGGWLLTDQGNYIFEKLEIESHSFSVKYRSAKFYLLADRSFTMPYFIKPKEIKLYGSKEATAIMLTGGDVLEYLEKYI